MVASEKLFTHDFRGLFNTKLYENSCSDVLLVFLPSMRSKSVRQKVPEGGYFPRITWHNKIKNYNILYVGDPYENFTLYEQIGGSWFISPDGSTVIPALAELINEISKKLGCEKVIVWGSSMGGYAAAVLSSYLDKCLSISECPQIYLDRHPKSKKVLEVVGNLDAKKYSAETLFEEGVRKLKKEMKEGKRRGGAYDINIAFIVNLSDSHYLKHVHPFQIFLKDLSFRFDLSENIRVLGYSSGKYGNGHTALKLDDALLYLNVFENDFFSG